MLWGCALPTHLSSMQRKHPVRGFTLIEILVVIGMLAILTTVVLVAVNPLRQFAQARNSQRQANVATILNAVSNRMADTRGLFEGASCDPLPTEVAKEISSESYDLRPCLVPTYLSEVPVDSSTGENNCTTLECLEEYSTEYTVKQDTEANRITVCAPGAAESALPESEEFCLSR